MAEHSILAHADPESQVWTASDRRPTTWRDVLCGVVLALAFFLLAAHRLEAPLRPVFDEVYQAQPGMEIAARGGFDGNVSHPPLVKEAIAASIRLTGSPADPEVHRLVVGKPKPLPPSVTWAWRLPSALMGALAVGLVFGFARDLTGSTPAAAAAAVLLALDGCFFVHARTAMTNVYEVAFVVAAAWAAWRVVTTGRDRWLVPAACAVGLAVACRWSGVYPLLLLGGWLAWHLRRSPRRLARLVAAWAVLPVACYLASYAPMLAARGLLLSGTAWWTEVFDMQVRMYLVHTNPTYVHEFASRWWSWPLMLRPVWYDAVFTPPTGNVVWAIGNAAIWWSTVPALLLAARAGWLGRKDLGLVAVVGLGTWFAWGIQPRSLLFMHYFLTVIPFGCLALVLIGRGLWHGRAPAGGPAILDLAAGRALVVGGLVAVAAWFVFYYPVLSSETIALPALNRRVWFGAAWL